MRKIALMALLLFTAIGSTFAQDEEDNGNQFKRRLFNHVGINVGAGLEGISVGVATPITNFFELEAGVNIMPKFNVDGDVKIASQTFTFTQNGQNQTYTTPQGTVNAKGNFSRTTVNVKAYVYPFGSNTKFFVAGGFSMGGKKIAEVTGKADENFQNYVNQIPAEYKQQILDQLGANLGGYNLPLNDDLSIDGDVRCNSFRPYLGLGFGRLVPKNRIGFRFELGCQFMGRLKVYQNDQELDLDKILEKAGEDDISKLIKNFKFYPCLKFSLVGRIL